MKRKGEKAVTEQLQSPFKNPCSKPPVKPEENLSHEHYGVRPVPQVQELAEATQQVLAQYPEQLPLKLTQKLQWNRSMNCCEFAGMLPVSFCFCRVCVGVCVRREDDVIFGASGPLSWACKAGCVARAARLLS